MRTTLKLRAMALAALMAGMAAASPVTAGDYYRSHSHRTHSCSYVKTVTVWETVRTPYYCYETRYTHCGRAYEVRVKKWKVVRVPVTKRIRVWH